MRRVAPSGEKPHPTEYLIPKRVLHQRARRGICGKRAITISSKANPARTDILRIKGMEELATHLVKEIQDVYLQGGLTTRTAICQMMQKIEIVEGGETHRSRASMSTVPEAGCRQRQG
ncbi:MAG: hypothetical protein H6924_01365 [Alphaproteobacteria bacterium]|nr:hypothetical protein [Alphaproteobacteria bacterium]